MTKIGYFFSIIAFVLVSAFTLAASGCTATKALYMSNEALLVNLAGQVGAAGCLAAGTKIPPAEQPLVCATLNGCAATLCPKVISDGTN